MATKLICDMCGKEKHAVKAHDWAPPGRNSLWGSFTKRFSDERKEIYDLCPSCSETIKIMITEVKNCDIATCPLRE